MGQQHGGLLLRPRVTVGHVRGDLLVAHVDKLDPAVGKSSEDGDIGVAAKAEHMLNAARLQVLDQLMRYLLFHGYLLLGPCLPHRHVIVKDDATRCSFAV